MVAEGAADIAAIDAVSWDFMKEYDDFTNSLKILYATPPTPGLPYISAAGVNRELYFNAIKQAIHDLPDIARKKLRINDLIDIARQDYFI